MQPPNLHTRTHAHPTTYSHANHTHTHTQAHNDIHTTLVQWAKLEKGELGDEGWDWGGGDSTNPAQRKWFLIIADQQTPAEKKREEWDG